MKNYQSLKTTPSFRTMRQILGVTSLPYERGVWKAYDYQMIEGHEIYYRRSSMSCSGYPSYNVSYVDNGWVQPPTIEGRTLLSVCPIPTYVRDQAYDKAVGKLSRELGEYDARWNAAVTIAEFGKTAHMFASTAYRLGDCLRKLRAGRLLDAYAVLNTDPSRPFGRWVEQNGERVYKSNAYSPADIWMEWRYGWRPFLGDLDDMVRYLGAKLSDRTLTCHYVSTKGYAERAYSVMDTGYPGAYNTIKQIGSRRLTYELYPRFIGDDGSHLLGDLGITNPALVAWEVIPFSFVFDWFWNVSKTIESWHTFSRWEVKRGLSSEYLEDLQFSKIDAGLASSAKLGCGTKSYPWYYVTKHGERSVRNRWFNRVPLTQLPTAVPLRLVPNNPFEFKEGNSSTVAKKVADSLALLMGLQADPELYRKRHFR